MKSLAKTTKLQSKLPALTLLAYFGAFFALFFLSNTLLADDVGIAAVSTTVSGQLNAVASLIIAVSYVAGVGFAMMGLLKLKAHKDNPTQVPLSQPIVLLVIAAALVFLPSVITTATTSIWGTEGTEGGTGFDRESHEGGAFGGGGGTTDTTQQ